MDLAAHSVIGPLGKLIAVCPNRNIAREVAEVLCATSDFTYRYREATPDELLGMLAEPAPKRDQRHQVVAGVDKVSVVIPVIRDTPVEPVDN